MEVDTASVTKRCVCVCASAPAPCTGVTCILYRLVGSRCCVFVRVSSVVRPCASELDLIVSLVEALMKDDVDGEGLGCTRGEQGCTELHRTS